MILHPSTYEIIVIAIFVSLICFLVGLVAYRIGKLDGYEADAYEKIYNFNRQLKIINQLTDLCDELETKLKYYEEEMRE